MWLSGPLSDCKDQFQIYFLLLVANGYMYAVLELVYIVWQKHAIFPPKQSVEPDLINLEINNAFCWRGLATKALVFISRERPFFFPCGNSSDQLMPCFVKKEGCVLTMGMVKCPRGRVYWRSKFFHGNFPIIRTDPGATNGAAPPTLICKKTLKLPWICLNLEKSMKLTVNFMWRARRPLSTDRGSAPSCGCAVLKRRLISPGTLWESLISWRLKCRFFLPAGFRLGVFLIQWVTSGLLRPVTYHSDLNLPMNT
jgi:hypothetical protein